MSFTSLIIIMSLIHWNVINSSKIVDGCEEFEAKLKDCSCKRKNLIQQSSDPNISGNVLYNQTTCSMNAYNRGMGQKIIGFSLYGDYNLRKFKLRGYLGGLEENLKLIPKYYPGWIVRLYTDYETEDQIFEKLCHLACQHPNLDICFVKELPGTPLSDASKYFPMNWRFFPTLDPQVDLFVSRDLDSRLSEREHAAVQEWLKSNKSIHVMRDHIEHGHSIMGGLWGTKLFDENVRSKWKMAWKNAQDDGILYAKRHHYGPDQVFLERYIWPWAENESLGHDSYYCQKYKNTKPFPTKRHLGPNNYVAAVPAWNLTAKPCHLYSLCHPNNPHPCSCTCSENSTIT